MDAPKREPSALAKDTGKVLERLEAWVEENPGATEYWIETELEAEQILLGMAAVIHQTMLAPTDLTQHDRRTLQDMANRYRLAVSQGRGLQTFREMTDEDQLHFMGVRLRVTPHNPLAH